ncbi:acyl carrier protein [Streptomyces sp. NPDC102395]|uniref:acyl carrier protein n=1 Tax=Streptomyces sp. NPDC102395 TaxID=3366168 RepID=UPI00381CF838
MLGPPADQVSRRDHFFDLDGTSLSAVRLAIALQRAVSLENLTHPVLADLAVLVGDRLETAPGVQCVNESVTPSSPSPASACATTTASAASPSGHRGIKEK